jgi:DNA repair protein RadC
MQVKLNELEKIRLLNSDDIYLVMQRILMRENKIERNKERFWIIGLAANNRILYIELISVGSIRQTLVEPMEVFSIALQKRTVKIILVHNHPSGSMKPSDADKDITDKLIQVGLFLNIPVEDHLIISEKSFYSFGDSGLLHDLRINTRYLLPYKVQENMKKEAEEIGKQKGKQEGMKEAFIKMAKQLKRKGFTIKQIQDLTGLKPAQINAIKPNTKAKPKPRA